MPGMTHMIADTTPGRVIHIVITRIKTAVNQSLAHIAATAGMTPTHVAIRRALSTIADTILTISSELISFTRSYTSLGRVDWRIC